MSDDRFVQEVTERHAILTIKDASKLDDGPYRLQLENELGSDSSVLKVQVNGKSRDILSSNSVNGKSRDILDT